MYLHAQPFPFQKHLQYNPIDKIIMLITATGVPIVEHILTFKEDQKLCGYVLSFVNVTGCNRFGPAYGFCLRPEKICHTETQHSFYLLKLFSLKKTTNKTKS